MNCACVPRVDGAVVTSRAVPGPGDHIEMLKKATNKRLIVPTWHRSDQESGMLSGFAAARTRSP